MEHKRDYSEPDLSDLFASFWSIKLYWGLGIFVGLLLGFTFQVIVQPFYEAQIIVGPVSRGSDTTFAERRDVGYAALEEDAAAFDFLQYQQVLTSSQAAERLMSIGQGRFLTGMQRDCAFKSCDRSDVSNWSAHQLADYLKRKVKSYSIGETVLRSIRYRHVDPDFAEELLKRLDVMANDIIRERMVLKAEKRIAYLHESMAAVSNPEHRRAFADLLLQQERELMMARLDEDYAAYKVLPATRKGRVVWPQSTVFVSLFVVVFFVLGLVLGGVRRSSRS